MADIISSTTGSSGITIIPEDEPSATTWIRENPVVTAVIIGGVLLLIIVIIFCFIRKKRKALASKEVNLNETENPSQSSVETSDSSSNNNVLPESFVIIQSPNLHSHTRVHQKRKSTLAVPPAFSVRHSKRKSAPSAHDLRRHSVVGWSRWSTAGLEIHTSPPPGQQQENPLPKGYAKKKRQSMPGIMMAVPVVYRRKSQAQHHAVYMPEAITLPPKPLTP